VQFLCREEKEIGNVDSEKMEWLRKEEERRSGKGALKGLHVSRVDGLGVDKTQLEYRQERVNDLSLPK
jgi:hypothetical protein